jgi:hypothetical protein
LGDHLQAAVGVEHLHQPRAYHRVIVDDQERDPRSHGSAGLCFPHHRPSELMTDNGSGVEVVAAPVFAQFVE